MTRFGWFELGIRIHRIKKLIGSLPPGLRKNTVGRDCSPLIFWRLVTRPRSILFAGIVCETFTYNTLALGFYPFTLLLYRAGAPLDQFVSSLTKASKP